MQMNYILVLSPQELWEYSDKLHLWRQLEYMLIHACGLNYLTFVYTADSLFF
jgi:hypothetical protein